MISVCRRGRGRGAVRLGAGAADPLALYGAPAPRDAEPGGTHEGPLQHHAAPLPLLAHRPAPHRTAPRRAAPT